MSAYGAATDYVNPGAILRSGKSWRVARCDSCGMQLTGVEGPSGIWCSASLLLSKISPTGQRIYRATCGSSANRGVCHRPHYYTCGECSSEETIVIE